ncbi:hypothetical protein VCRA2120E57_140112 [Vibrio crassostreae]|nr:hypothetical protein VCRA2120E57_140112 [Vibrio crassostreae]
MKTRYPVSFIEFVLGQMSNKNQVISLPLIIFSLIICLNRRFSKVKSQFF